MDAKGLTQEDETDLFEADWLIITIPPSGADDYAGAVRSLAEASRAAGDAHPILTSSTSVYPDLNRVVTEDDAETTAGPPRNRNGDAVLAAERALSSVTPSAAILRLAGLYGPDRHPVRYLAGRTGLSGARSPVNLVHRDDVVRAVQATIFHRLTGPYNVVADEHPAREDLYTALAQRIGLDAPQFDERPTDWKIVSGDALKRAAGFRYLHPDPNEWIPE